MSVIKFFLVGFLITTVIILSSSIAQAFEEAKCDLAGNTPSIKNAQKYFHTANHKCVISEINNLLDSGQSGKSEELYARILMVRSYYLDDIDDEMKYELITAQFDTILDLSPRTEIPEELNSDSIYTGYYSHVQDSIINYRLKEGKIKIAGAFHLTFPSSAFSDYYNSGSGFGLSGLYRFKRFNVWLSFDYFVHSRGREYNFSGSNVWDQSKTHDFMISLNSDGFIPLVCGGPGISFTRFEFDLDYLGSDRTFKDSKWVTKFVLRLVIGVDIRLNRYWGMQVRLGSLTKTDFGDDNEKKNLPRFDEKAECYYFLSIGAHLKP